MLSHPAKNRIIADAQIKNDRVDAKALATLLHGDFVARVHVPAKPAERVRRWGVGSSDERSPCFPSAARSSS